MVIEAGNLKICEQFCDYEFPDILILHQQYKTDLKYAEPQSRRDCCDVTVAKRLFPNLFKYAESQSRSDCCDVTVAKRLLCFPIFLKYAEPQSRSDCYAAPTRRSRQLGIKRPWRKQCLFYSSMCSTLGTERHNNSSNLQKKF